MHFGQYCSATGCHSCTYREGKQGIKFFRFPKDPVKRQRWIAQVNRTKLDGSPWTPHSNARLCSKHFVSGKSSNDPEDHDYAPTIFPASTFTSSTKPRKRRHDGSQMKEVPQPHVLKEEEQDDIMEGNEVEEATEDEDSMAETSEEEEAIIREDSSGPGPSASYKSSVFPKFEQEEQTGLKWYIDERASTSHEQQQNYAKPPFSYKQLIGQALMTERESGLPISDIYSFISQNYPFYKMENQGWQNSVRHNLSLHKGFENVPSHICPTQKAVKGNCWRTRV